MQALRLNVGEDRYAVDALRVVEVVPKIPLRPVPGAPPSLAGLLEYRGQVIPVVDLCLLLGEGPCPARMTSRIAVLSLDEAAGVASQGRSGRRVGVLAEGVTRVVEIDPDAADAVSGPASPGIPALGRVVPSGGGLIRLVQVDQLVPNELYDELTRGNAPDGEASS